MNVKGIDCKSHGHSPGMWMRVDFNMQERVCQVCGMVLETANIPYESVDLKKFTQ